MGQSESAWCLLHVWRRAVTFLPSRLLEKSPGKGTPPHTTARLQTHFLQRLCSTSSYYMLHKKPANKQAMNQVPGTPSTTTFGGPFGALRSTLQLGRTGASPRAGTSHQCDPEEITDPVSLGLL